MEPPQLQGFQTLAQPRPKYRLQWEPVQTLVTPTGAQPSPIAAYTTDGVRYIPQGVNIAYPLIETAYFDVVLPYRSSILGLQFYKPLQGPPERNNNQFRWVVYEWQRMLSRQPNPGTSVPVTTTDMWQVNPYFDYRHLSDPYALTFAREMALQRYRTYAPGFLTLWGFINDGQTPVLTTPNTWPIIERVLLIQWDAS